jgi:hypothetical protein
MSRLRLEAAKIEQELRMQVGVFTLRSSFIHCAMKNHTHTHTHHKLGQ